MSKPKTLIMRFTANAVQQDRNFYKFPDDKPKVGQVTSETIKFGAVSPSGKPGEVYKYGYESKPDDEVQSFADATPWGELQIQINNLHALGVIKQGLDYYIKIEEVPEELQTNTEAVEFWKNKKAAE